MDIVGKLFWLFLIYSFLGWVLETVSSAMKQKRFVNRGIINGPFCVIYGIGAVIVTITMQELSGIWLFLGSAILATVIEWIAGHLVERFYSERWWNYKNMPYNLDGYVSLPTSLLWGALGFIVMKWGNQICFTLYHLVPSFLRTLLLWSLFALIFVDGLASIIVLIGTSQKVESWSNADRWIDSLSIGIGNKIYNFVDRRIQKAYPNKEKVELKEKHKEIFAYGCGFYKVVMLFFIGAFLGDIVETIFCKLTTGVWMSRSSVVWGPFSIVWGLAISTVTVLLYQYKDKSDSFLFLVGTFLGGAYEYICSVFTEIVFGTVFWDYSDIPFNLGGRINLLFCFFWGIAAVIWFKKLYPFFSNLMEKLKPKTGKVMTWILIVFMICNICMSMAALIRYNQRNKHVDASNSVEVWLDKNYNNKKMEKIYPNAIYK